MGCAFTPSERRAPGALGVGPGAGGRSGLRRHPAGRGQRAASIPTRTHAHSGNLAVLQARTYHKVERYLLMVQSGSAAMTEEEGGTFTTHHSVPPTCLQPVPSFASPHGAPGS